MTVRTRTQRIAELAWQAFAARTHRSAEYDSFARSFPALMHAAGLCQAIAYVQAKGKENGAPSQLLEDVAYCMHGVQPQYSGKEAAEKLVKLSRTASATEYIQLTRAAILAAGFIKRYSEAADAAIATTNALEA